MSDDNPNDGAPDGPAVGSDQPRESDVGPADARPADARPPDARDVREERSDPLRGGPRDRDRRRAAERGNSLSWVHRFRVTPGALLILVLLIGGIWALFEFTGLGDVLFP